MKRNRTVRRARALRAHFQWLRETYFSEPPSTPQGESLLGLLCDFECVLTAIIQAASSGDWATANQLTRVFNEANRDFVNDVIRPNLRRLAEEN